MFAVQPEPERRHRGRVFAGAAALALLVQGGALLVADRLKHERPTPPRPPVSFTLVTPPAPPPPPPSAAPAPPSPAPATAAPLVHAKPRAPRPNTPKPAAPPVTGLNAASTVSAGAGPVFAAGNTVMGTPEPVAAVPSPAPVVVAGAAPPPPPTPTKPEVPAGPRAPARLRQKVAPPYPEAARSEGLEGEVVLMLTIDERGHVTGVRLVKGLAPPLDAAAVEAARATLWDPARVGDTPVTTTQRFNVRFTLEG